MTQVAHCTRWPRWPWLLLAGMLILGAGGWGWRLAHRAAPPAPSQAAPSASAPVPAPPAPATPRPALPVVCLDPGHPSEVGTGATAHGVREVEAVYDVAQLLRQRLEERGIARVVLTRDFRSPGNGRRVTNRRRAEIANAAGAALLLRLHCDAGGGAGFALYYPDREGTSDGTVGPPEQVRAASQRAADVLHRALAEDLSGHLADNGVKGDTATLVGGQHGALIGSIFARVPVVTVEMVFLTDPADARFIATPDGQARMADALAHGVAAWLKAGQG